MENLNKILTEPTDIYTELNKVLEKSDVAFCSNETLSYVLKDFNISKKMIGDFLRSIECEQKVIKSKGKCVRGWMVRYIGK